MSAEPRPLHPPQEVTIDPADIRWRVGQISKKDQHKGSLLGYIDARTCMEALDHLDPNWSAVHGDPIIIGDELVGVPCALTVNGVTRSDVGMPSSQEPIKGAYSDALKRAAVHFGIGRELYELPRIYVKLDDYKKPVAIPTYRNGRWTLPSGAGSVFYDREPEDQPQGGERSRASGGARSVSATTRPAAQRTPEEQALLDELLAVPGMTTDRMTLLADAVGVPKGERANAEQLRAMLDLIETPPSEPGPSPATADDPVEATVAGSEDAATPPGGPSEPGPAPTYTEDTLRTLASAVLELDATADWTLKQLDGSDWDRVFDALKVGDDAAYTEWYGRQPREIRAVLMTAKQSPKARRDRAAEAARAKPDAETLRMGLEEGK